MFEIKPNCLHNIYTEFIDWRSFYPSFDVLRKIIFFCLCILVLLSPTAETFFTMKWTNWNCYFPKIIHSYCCTFKLHFWLMSSVFSFIDTRLCWDRRRWWWIRLCYNYRSLCILFSLWSYKLIVVIIRMLMSGII